MATRFLLDSNILSEATKLRPSSEVVSRLAENSQQLATATVVYHEILFGCWRMPDSRKKKAIEANIRQTIEGVLPLFPYCEIAARWHAAERVRLEKQGKTPTYFDGQIAAIAKVNNLTLVTRNVKDFKHFQDLKIENWFD